MKKILFFIFVLMLFYNISYAAGPYLVCDPQTGVDYYVISGLPSNLNGNNISPDSTGTYGFKFDISIWPSDGLTYSLNAYACSKSWGCSGPSLPFVSSRPKVPSNTKLIIQ